MSYSAAYLIEMAKALVDSAVKVIEFPAAAADSNVGGSKAHSLAVDLTGELIFLNDYLEMANDRANDDQSDGRLVAMLAAAMPRMKRALEISNELEVSHG